MESLRINYIIPFAVRTGGTRVLLNFMNELSKLGHEVSMSTLYYRVLLITPVQFSEPA